MTTIPDHPAASDETGLSQILSSVDRQQAFRTAQRHSAIVKTLRVAFPAVAIAAAGLYFLKFEFSFSVGDIEAQFERVEISPKQSRIIKPSLRGFNKKHGFYVVNASQAVQNIKNPDQVQLTAIDAHVTNADKSWAKIIAERGTFHNKKEFLTLQGGIIVTSSTGITATLDAADIDMKKQLIVAKSPVSVTLTNGTVRAENMEISTAIRKVAFSKNVRVHLVPSKKSGSAQKPAKGSRDAPFSGSNKPIDISADRLEIFDKDKLATFSGNVKADQDGLNLTSDHLQIRYEGDANATLGSSQTAITTIEARDNVAMTSPDKRRATSDRLVLDNQTREVTLEGNVTLYQGDNRLQGHKLLVNLNTRRTVFPAGSRVKGRFVPTRSDKTITKKANKTPKAGETNDTATSFAGLGTNNDKPIFVEANELNIFDDEKRAVFRGNVKVKQGGYRLDSETLEMIYSGDGAGRPGSKTTVSKIIAIDKVLLETTDHQRVTSNKAIFDVKTNIVTIDGNVVLTRGQDIIKGDQLIIDLSTNRSWVKNHGKAGTKQRVRVLLGPRSFQKNSNQSTKFGFERR